MGTSVDLQGGHVPNLKNASSCTYSVRWVQGGTTEFMTFTGGSKPPANIRS